MSILQKNKKVAAGIGIAAAAAAAIALGTGTYAAFTDTKAGPGGTLAAGTLSLDLGQTGSAALFNESDIYPGKVLPAKVVTIHNAGSINGVLTATATITPNTGGDLQNQLMVAASCTSDRTGSPSFSSGPVVVNTITSALMSNLRLPVKAGETYSCSFTFNLPDRTDNNLVQGDKIAISSNFTLTQATAP